MEKGKWKTKCYWWFSVVALRLHSFTAETKRCREGEVVRFVYNAVTWREYDIVANEGSLCYHANVLSSLNSSTLLVYIYYWRFFAFFIGDIYYDSYYSFLFSSLVLIVVLSFVLFTSLCIPPDVYSKAGMGKNILLLNLVCTRFFFSCATCLCSDASYAPCIQRYRERSALTTLL